MNKTKTFLLLYFLIPFLVIPPVLAAPTVTVTNPNGNEILAGTSTIDFTVTNTAIVSTFEADINLSFAAGAFDHATISTDLNLLSTCDYEVASLRWLLKDDKETNLDGNVFVYPDMVEYLGQTHLFSRRNTAPLNTNVLTWNSSTTSWDQNSDLNTGLPVAAAQPIQHFFILDSTLYGLGFEDLGGSNYARRGWRYEPANSWVADTNITNNLEAITKAQDNYVVIESVQSKDWLILTTGQLAAAGGTVTGVHSYYWDGLTNGWQRDDYLARDLNMLQPPDSAPVIQGIEDFVVFKINSVLYSLVKFGGTAIPANTFATFKGMQFDTSIGKWIANEDINKGLSTDANNWYVSFTDQLGAEPTIIENYLKNTGQISLSSSYDRGTALDTTASAECSIPFVTTDFDNGNWFIDINVSDSLLATAADSSDVRFTILNWTNADVNCACISNCSSCTLDVNAFIVVPSTETTDIQIKIENGTGNKDIGYKIKNSNDSGKQYKIHTASTDDYADNVWNYSNSLTFGTTNYDAVQKIWKPSEEKYEYFFSDLVLSAETIYYKFEYYEPAIHYYTVANPNWDNQLAPDVTDYNGLSTDMFYVSFYSDMASFLTTPEFPKITSNLSNVNYVLQFTSKANTVVSSELKAGTVEDRSFSPATSLNLDNRYKTLTVTGIENGFVKIESAATTARDYWFQNYAISERGFFTKPLEFFDADGTELPVLIGDENTYSQYIVEGSNFLIKTQYNDPDGVIDRYEITAYINLVADANKIKKWVFDADEDGLVDISEVIGGIIDLTPNADDRTIRLTARVIDENTNYYEIQSDSLTLRQFPTNSRDLLFSIRQDNKKIGDHPKGRVTIETIAPENIIGVEINIQDEVTDNNNADFNKTFYKGIDFTCNAFDCSFDYEIEEYIFPSSATYRLDAWALVTTEEKGTDISLLHKMLIIPVSWITFDTARIFQVNERSDRTYRNDEIIPLVVQLRDSTGANLKSKVHLKMQVAECDAATVGACQTIDINYFYNSHLYDLRTGYNYFFFRQLFVEEDYTPFSDGNFLRFKAFIEDPTKTHQTLYQPVLGDKCQATDPLTFWANLLTMNYFSDGTTCLGCTSGNCTNEIVALPDNNAHEVRIEIDIDHSTTAPTQYWWLCTEPDQNNLYTDVLAQDILCWTWYLMGEKPIDKFKFYLTNQNSDLSEDREEYKQFVEVDVPFEIIYSNDITLTRKALEKNYQTDSVDTIGEMLQLQADYLLGALAPTITIAGNAFAATGLIGNVGFEMGAVEAGNTVDFNFNTPINPAAISGVILYRIRNLNIINKKDYEEIYPNVKTISAKRFVEYADLENIRLKSKDIEIDVYVSDMIKVMEEESEAKFIIDEEIRNITIRQERADENTIMDFPSIPTTITFEAVSDMIYNNEKTYKRRYLILPYRLILEPRNLCGWFGFNCWGTTDEGSIGAVITQGDLSFFARNWVFIFAAMLAILFISVVYGNIKGKGIQIHMPSRG